MLTYRKRKYWPHSSQNWLKLFFSLNGLELKLFQKPVWNQFTVQNCAIGAKNNQFKQEIEWEPNQTQGILANKKLFAGTVPANNFNLILNISNMAVASFYENIRY